MRARLRARAALQQPREVVRRRRGRRPRSSIVPTSTRFMLRMNESASIANSSTSPRALPARARARRARSAGGSRRLGVKAVKSCVPGSSAAQACSAASSKRMRPPQRAAALERRRRACGRAPGSGRCGCGRRGGRRSPSGASLGRQHRDLGGSSALSERSARQLARRRRRPARARARRGRCGRRRSARPARRSTVGQRPRSSPCDRPLARLDGPAGERARRRTRAVAASVRPRRLVRPARGRPSRSRPSDAGRA